MNATNPESGTIGYTYDFNGNLLTRTDARSMTSIAYDGLNRVKTKTYSDGTTPNVSYCYDGQAWNGSQCTGTPAPPFMGRLRDEVSTASSTSFTNYDVLGRATASAQTTGGTVYTFSNYSYKLNDGLSQVTYPSGRQISYDYTGAGRVSHVSGVKDSVTTNYTSATPRIHYTAHGAIDSIQLGNGLGESTSYNGRLQPTQILVPGLLTLGYDFGSSQNNGNVQSQTIARGSTSWSQAYSYDGVNRLASASESGSGSWSQAYGYDNFGNRSVSSSSSTLPPLTLQVPTGSNWFVNNKILTSPSGAWTYDNAGNLQAMAGMPGWGFTYDAENRQITAVTASSPTTTYAYDGEGRRVTKTWNGQTTTFVYDAFGKLAAEYGGPVGNLGTQYLTTDHLGSTRLVTDFTGAAVKCYDYLPFGEEIGNGTAGRSASCFGSGSYPVAGGATNREFTSKERDAETGLDFFGARYYSAAQGRWTTADWSAKPQPVPYADLKDPQTLNLYAYVRNNPPSKIDPDGHCSAPKVKDGEVGICIDTYIKSRILPKLAPGIGLGDNRGPAANDPKKTYRQEIQLVIAPGSQPRKVKDDGGTSIAITPIGLPIWGKGSSITSVSDAKADSSGIQHFSLNSVGLNGLSYLPGAPGDAIKTSLNFSVTPDGRVGLDAGGVRTAYPSIEIYTYGAGGNIRTIYQRSESGNVDDLKQATQPVPAVSPQ